MGRTKDLYIELHEKKIAEYLEQHPEADEQEAYEKTSDSAYDELGDYMADLADRARDEAKDRELEQKDRG